eukprot:1392295-Pyramimonas_sp.AAC.1
MLLAARASTCRPGREGSAPARARAPSAPIWYPFRFSRCRRAHSRKQLASPAACSGVGGGIPAKSS